MFKTEQLLEPISAARPCGEDLSFSSEFDAIARARQADDPSLEQGAWVSKLKEADWPFVARRCVQLTQTRSKDLRLAVWLVEASAQTSQMRALGDALLLVAGLCERYWDGVYPLPDEAGHEQRIGNLCWLAARAPQLIAHMALTEDGAHSLAEFEAARARLHADPDALAELDGARRKGSGAHYTSRLEDASHCLRALASLELAVDERLGADGPGFSAVRTVLHNVIHFLTQAALDAGVFVEEAGAVATKAAPVAPLVGGPLHSREQALAQLRAVAEFFRRTEPHSPVAYLADKAAGWGEQPLHVWLRGVVKDPAAFAHLEELLGLNV